ncbi:MAG: DUF177 domain-containing protein [Albidovulum sp.]|nr:DUF177 domain-containing protein [Albidovulum sp.]MDE0531298.1 DUF177 domain-containing protein [Albidovulum sp.]
MGKKRFEAAAARKSRLSIEIAELRRNNGGKFDLRLDTTDRYQLAVDVGVTIIPKLRFAGEIIFAPPSDWLLKAKLGATVVQQCVVTLDPVRTRIESVVERRYSPDSIVPVPGSCVPMPDDENMEPIADEIDLRALICESLVLDLPLYPKREGVRLGAEQSSSGNNVREIHKHDKPFAILSEFRKQLER